MVECELPKLNMRVRFPLPAPINKDLPCGGFLFIDSLVGKRTRKGGFDYKREASGSAPVRQSRTSAVNEVSPLPAPINKDLPCGGFWFIDSLVGKRTRKSGFGIAMCAGNYLHTSR